MKMYQTIVFILCLLTSAIFGQNPIDSLKLLIENAPDDTAKIWLYRELFRQYHQQNQTEKMMEVAAQGLELSRDLEYLRGLDYMIYYQAIAFELAGRGAEAIPLYQEGLALAQASNNQSSTADYYIQLGVTHFFLGQLEKALSNYLNAHDIYEQLGQKENLAKVLNNIGIIYRMQQRYERALEIYWNSYQLKKTLGDSIGMAASLQNLGLVFSHLGDKKQALQHLTQGLGIYQRLEDPEGVANCFNSLGNIYLDWNDIPPAKQAFEQAWTYFEKHHEADNTPSTLQGLGQVAVEEKNYSEAEKYFKQALDLAETYGQKEVVLDLMKSLGQVLEKLDKNSEAVQVMGKTFLLQDTLAEENRQALLQEMQAKFDLKQKDSALKISQLELLQRTRQYYMTIGVAIGLALLAISIFLGLKSRIRANQRIAQQHALIQSQQIRQLEQENKLTALQSMIEGQEKERMRIAQDLHDSLGGLLTAVKAHFDSLKLPKEKPLYEKTNQLIDEACVEVRRISHNMMPRSLSLAGLQGALEDMMLSVEKQEIDCQLDVIDLDEKSFSPTQLVMVFRIAQELINNMLKHAKASQLLFQFIQKEQELTIIYEDDGKGFVLEKALQQKSLGISNIESRIRFLQGEIEWDSVPGEGTTVSMRIPIHPISMNSGSF